MIVKTSKGYHVESKSGKNMGGGPSKASAQKRLREVEYFKHKGK